MKSVFVDIDTQLDFLYPAGALYTAGAETIEPALERLTRFASAHNIQIISTADAHAENDPEFETWKPHCVTGTQGQAKSSVTLLPKPLVLSSGVAVPSAADALSAAQIIFEKQQIDPFEDPRLSELLDKMAAERFVVYGLVLEHCVKASLFGLIRRGARVEFVAEASCSLNVREEQETLARFTSEGGTVITLAEACS